MDAMLERGPIMMHHGGPRGPPPRVPPPHGTSMFPYGGGGPPPGGPGPMYRRQMSGPPPLNRIKPPLRVITDVIPPQDRGPPGPPSAPGGLSPHPRLTVTPSSPDSVGPALARLGKSIGLSVEMLATVGETIGEENPDIRGDMQTACRESRAVAGGLEKLCESLSINVIGSSMANGGPGPPPSSQGGGTKPGSPGVMGVTQNDLEALLRTLRLLLAAVTRILLLADNVVVKQLLNTGGVEKGGATNSPATNKKKGGAQSSNQAHKKGGAGSVGGVVGNTGGHAPMSTMHHFNEFVKAFCDFGSEMIHLIRITTGKGENCPKEERWRAQMESARFVLERSSALLLSSAKTFQRHPDTQSARENRDTVFCQMRRALDLIHFIVKEGVIDSSNKVGLDGIMSGHVSHLAQVGTLGSDAHLATLLDAAAACEEQDNEEQLSTSTVLGAIKYFEDSVEIMRMSIISDSYKDQLTNCLESIIERTQDFTDSAYTSHEHRSNIIILCDRSRMELVHLLRTLDHLGTNANHHHGAPTGGDMQVGSNGMGVLDVGAPQPPSREMDLAMQGLLKTTTELRLELQQTALELAGTLLENGCQARERVHAGLLNAALSADYDQLQIATDRLTEHIDFVEDVAKLVRHVTWTEGAQVRAKHAQINLHIYGPQVGVAASTLCREPHSKVTKDNFEMFCNMWQHLLMDVIHISKMVAEQTNHLNSMAIGGRSLKGVGPPVVGAGGVVVPPTIVKEPPTPNHSPPYSPLHRTTSGPGGPVGGAGGPPTVNVSGPPGGPQQPPQGMGKLFHNKSVPNLSSSCVTSTANMNTGPNPLNTLGQPQSAVNSTSINNFLDPNMGLGGPGPGPGGLNPNSMAMEPRRHSTSGVPGYMMPPSGNYLGGYPPGYYGGGNRPVDILNSYKDVDNNEIIKRAKKMAVQAEDMFHFTRGQGKVKTTQDLFTLAEYFAEECNVLYKVIRLFSYDVPTGEDKRSLMAIADNVPKHCHQLQMLIQSPTVGKAATFTKVDSIIKESRQIVSLILRVVQICFENSKKYNLDFSNVSLEREGANADSNIGASSSSGES